MNLNGLPHRQSFVKLGQWAYSYRDSIHDPISVLVYTLKHPNDLGLVEGVETVGRIAVDSFPGRFFLRDHVDLFRFSGKQAGEWVANCPNYYESADTDLGFAAMKSHRRILGPPEDHGRCFRHRRRNGYVSIGDSNNLTRYMLVSGLSRNADYLIGEKFPVLFHEGYRHQVSGDKVR